MLIIKLGALGDVLRTTTLLPAIRQRFKEHAVFWITFPCAVQLLHGSGLQAILPWSVDAALFAQNTNWDMVISLDKEEGPTALATLVNSPEKHGFGRNKYGLLIPLSESSGELYSLGLDNDFKYNRNSKTYPQLIAEACGLDWGPNKYILELAEPERRWAEEFSQTFGKGGLVGLNIGSGDGFAGKRWPIESFIELAARLHDEGVTPVFLGGGSERELYAELRARAGLFGVFPGCEFTLRRFIALVSKLDVIVSGDSLAMHIGIARGVYSVTLFGSTTDREIEFYGYGEALVGRVHCSPCYKKKCPTSEECMAAISVDAVHAAIARGLGRSQEKKT